MARYPKLFLLRDEKKTRLKLPEDLEAPFVTPGGHCPECRTESYTVSGHKRRIASDDRAYEADAYCNACARMIGTLRLEVSTLFGLREDEAVLKGRCRVY